jgi:hypothetical protein
MRYNTITKRKKVREQMIRFLIAQGFMYYNSADEIADKWIENGLRAFPKNSFVWDAVRMGMCFISYKKKGIVWL